MNVENTPILYGDAAFVAPTPRALRAGPLTLIYENGDLRRIRLGGKQLVNRIYAAVRGDDWGTPPAVRTEIERTIGEDSFRIVYDARHTDAAKGIDFTWRGTLTGDADGTITFDFDGEALSTFWRNRLGICVLHPAALAGSPCTVRHADGSGRKQGFIPILSRPISPSSTFPPSRSPQAMAQRRRWNFPAIPSRWRISATGWTLPTRRTRPRFHSPTRSKSRQGRGSDKK